MLGCDFFSPNTNTQIHKRWFFISAKEKKVRRDGNHLLCICFVRKVISLDDFTDTHYKMTRSLFVNSENSICGTNKSYEWNFYLCTNRGLTNTQIDLLVSTWNITLHTPHDLYFIIPPPSREVVQ